MINTIIQTPWQSGLMRWSAKPFPFGSASSNLVGVVFFMPVCPSGQGDTLEMYCV